MQQKHDLSAYMDTPINLKAVKKTKFSNHTAICSAMIAESHALNKEKKAGEKAVVKAAKKEAMTLMIYNVSVIWSLMMITLLTVL